MKRILSAAIVLVLCIASMHGQITQKYVNQLCKQADFKMPKMSLPKISGKQFSILEYGADPTGVKLSTDAIQQAIDAAHNAGGGTVMIPAGIFLTGPIVLKIERLLVCRFRCTRYFLRRFQLVSHNRCLF